MWKFRTIIVSFVIFIVFYLVLVNHFMGILTYETSIFNDTTKTTTGYETRILAALSSLPSYYYKRQSEQDQVVEVYFQSLRRSVVGDVAALWREVNEGVTNGHLYLPNKLNVGSVLHAMKTSRIVHADLDTRGTQLKLLLTLEGNQTVVFKPKWYAIDRTIEGPVYAGKDRYQSEILAFHLSAILNRHLVPLAVERRIDLRREILPVASARLLKTHFQTSSNNSTCIYGQCHYCKREDPVCDSGGYLTGAVIFNVAAELKGHRSPWQRTYNRSRKAVWETKANYCNLLVANIRRRLYELVDTAIFDFLIQNGDRHHFETLDDKIVWIDNGKGLGNANLHHIDILAPLYQCCTYTLDTYNRLINLSGGLLTEYLRKIPDVRNVITEDHLEAIDKRLMLIFATIEFCKVEKAKLRKYKVHD